MAFLTGLTLLVCIGSLADAKRVSYSGHKVLTVTPKTNDELELLYRLKSEYKVDLWNEPRFVNQSVMMRLEPRLAEPVAEFLAKKRIEYFVAFHDLQKIIDEERVQHAPSNASRSIKFDYGKYHTRAEINEFIRTVEQNNPYVAKYQVFGKSFDNLPIYLIRITSDILKQTKPVIMIECGSHSREWASVAACLFLINELISKYNGDDLIKSLVDKYEFIIMPLTNPDGYLISWEEDRLWRKTRSLTPLDFMSECPGADIDRNFDIDHCGVGASRDICHENYCGNIPFSERETRNIKGKIDHVGSRLKAYFSIHAYSQLWMTPYGISENLPANYEDLVRVANAGVKALSRKYGTQYRIGSIAKTKALSSGSPVDYVYEKLNVKMAFKLYLRDSGKYGYLLPQELIIPTCEETAEGIIAAVAAI